MSLRKPVKYICLYSISEPPQGSSYTLFIDNWLADNLREQLAFWSAKSRPRSVAWQSQSEKMQLDAAQCRTLWRKHEVFPGNLRDIGSPATLLPASVGRVMASLSPLCKTGLIQRHLGAWRCRTPSEKAVRPVHLKQGFVLHPSAVCILCTAWWIYSITWFVAPPGFTFSIVFSSTQTLSW